MKNYYRLGMLAALGRCDEARERVGAGHLLQGRPADPAGELPDLPSARRSGADVAPHLRAGAAVGAGDQDRRRRRGRCRRGLPIPAYGHFANERRLSRARDRRRSARGPTPARRRATRTTRRAPLTFDDGWNIKPDIIVEMPKPFELPARGTINYKYILVEDELHGGHVGDRRRDAARQPDRCCTTARCGCGRPDRSGWRTRCPARRTSRDPARHHRQNAIEEGNDILGKFNPGPRRAALRHRRRGEVRPEGIGPRVRAALHDDRASRAPTSRSSGSCSRKDPPQKRYLLPRRPDGAATSRFLPATATRKSSARSRSATNAQLVYAQPHMHLRGKDFELRVVSPDTASRRRCSRATSTSSGRWATSTPSRSRCRRASKLQLITHFDNSPANRFNPDPTKKVVLGTPELGRDEQLLHRRAVRREDRAGEGVPRERTEPAARRRSGTDIGGDNRHGDEVDPPLRLR